MVFNATFDNILVISWQSVLLSMRRKPQTCRQTLLQNVVLDTSHERDSNSQL
jgi:hypothetical protein